MVFVFLSLALALGLAGIAAGAKKKPVEPQPTPITTPDKPELYDTATNLQAAFSNEMNARERYLAFAKEAVTEGHESVARLFRACAQAESVHARRHVQAIAYTGQPARARLERVAVGTTEDNLRTAINAESYEVSTWYPALIARARADKMSMAVRSCTLALETERGHVHLLSDALANLPGPPVAHLYYVCPYCGRTVDTLNFKKCPGCFTNAGRFLRPA
jgi:rubrerythrin